MEGERAGGTPGAGGSRDPLSLSLRHGAPESQGPCLDPGVRTLAGRRAADSDTHSGARWPPEGWALPGVSGAPRARTPFPDLPRGLSGSPDRPSALGFGQWRSGRPGPPGWEFGVTAGQGAPADGQVILLLLWIYKNGGTRGGCGWCRLPSEKKVPARRVPLSPRVLQPARGRSYSGPSPGFSSKLGSQRWTGAASSLALFSGEHRGFFPLLRLSSVLLLITRTLFCRGIEAKLNEEQGKKSGLLFISLLLGKFRSSMLAPNVLG